LPPLVPSPQSSNDRPPKSKTAGLEVSNPAVVHFATRSIAMPAAIIPIVIPIPTPVPAAAPVVITIMAVAMAGRHDHDWPRPVCGRPPNDRPRMNWTRHDHDGREDRPWHHDHRRRTNGWRRRTDHPGRRREAEGDAEVEVRPRRGGDCESQGEGTDSDYGFGFHNGSFDEAALGRFGFSPLIELISALTVWRSMPVRRGGQQCQAQGARPITRVQTINAAESQDSPPAETACLLPVPNR